MRETAWPTDLLQLGGQPPLKSMCMAHKAEATTRKGCPVIGKRWAFFSPGNNEWKMFTPFRKATHTSTSDNICKQMLFPSRHGERSNLSRRFTHFECGARLFPHLAQAARVCRLKTKSVGLRKCKVEATKATTVGKSGTSHRASSVTDANSVWLGSCMLKCCLYEANMHDGGKQENRTVLFRLCTWA
jgi:hypothetical protein